MNECLVVKYVIIYRTSACGLKYIVETNVLYDKGIPCPEDQKQHCGMQKYGSVLVKAASSKVTVMQKMRTYNWHMWDWPRMHRAQEQWNTWDRVLQVPIHTQKLGLSLNLV